MSQHFVVKSEDPLCDPNQTVDAKLAEEQPYCLPQQVAWAAPNLQVASLKYDRKQLTQIITYGRPGTPMPAWGVLSGKGALQEQSIQDLVNYVESLGTTPDKAQAAATKELENCDRRPRASAASTLDDPEVQAAADKWVADAKAELAAAIAERERAPGVGTRPPSTTSSCSRSRTPSPSPSSGRRPRSRPATARCCS